MQNRGNPRGQEAGFHSLRTRLILPLMLAAGLATGLVATVSYWQAERASSAQSAQRFAAIEGSLRRSNFPLSRNVLTLLGDLTSADWFTLGPDGEVLESSLDLDRRGDRDVWESHFSRLSVTTRGEAEPATMWDGDVVYRAMRYRVNRGVRRGVDAPAGDVVILFDDSQWRSIRYRAAAAPLLTGLSTIVLLTSITLWLTGRLVTRITRLQREVETIAEGHFAGSLLVGPRDELGQLAMAVRSLADQLGQMWKALSERHGQRLLHQIAGGLAHNLRNTLTGARMAIELAEREPAGSSRDQGLQVALGQLDQAEDYVERLLMVSRGKSQANRPLGIAECLAGLRAGLDSTAAHQGVRLAWTIEDGLATRQVADGPTLVAAVSNLVWNALQAGRDVEVVADWRAQGHGAAGECRIEVTDDGPGPPPELGETMFDPFVTSKPEGIGLGLAVVRRAAETLGGAVEWRREGGRTRFSIRFPVV